MPLRQFHSARLKDPKQFDSFSYGASAGGPGISFVYGIKDGKSTIQAIRFDIHKFSVAEAKAWLKKHNYHPISFEPAKPDGKDVNAGMEKMRK